MSLLTLSFLSLSPMIGVDSLRLLNDTFFNEVDDDVIPALAENASVKIVDVGFVETDSSLRKIG